MVRYSRNLLRLALAVVLAAGLIGAWWASTFWSVDAASLIQLPGLGENTDWVDMVAALADQAIQFFIGIAQ